MVVGGPWVSLANSEVVNLSGDGKTCTAPLDHPEHEGQTGTFIGGLPIVCGGETSGVRTDKCYRYDAQVRKQH